VTGSGDVIAGVCVNMYADNAVPEADGCGGSLTDGNGQIELTGSHGGWFAYQVFPAADRLRVVHTHLVTPGEGDVVRGYSVSDMTASLIVSLLVRQRDPEGALFTGTIRDCNGAPVEGATFRVVRGGSVVPEGVGSQDAMYAYFGGTGLPSPDQPYTNAEGQYIAINIPVEDQGEAVLLVACGKPDGETLEVIGCEGARSFSNTVHIADIGPTRDDGLTCPDVCAQ
jgi:hypothetical protein